MLRHHRRHARELWPRGDSIHLAQRHDRRHGSACGSEQGCVEQLRVPTELRRTIRKHRPDVAHFENIFPLVSPAAYYACRSQRVPVVQTLHNYRMACLSAILYRNGAVCEKCVSKRIAWPGVLHGCYRGSRLGSAVVATMIGLHRAAGTWNRQVDAYIALNQFARGKLIEAGLEAERIYVNPNFLTSIPEPGDGAGGYALFAGRLRPGEGHRDPSHRMGGVGTGSAAEDTWRWSRGRSRR